MMPSSEKTVKEYNLFIMRSHFQVQAKQIMLGNELYQEKGKPDLDLYKNFGCPHLKEPEIKQVEKYKIFLNLKNPNLQDLYSKISDVCPEFNNKKTFYLYWKYSATEILPISNYITYLSMMSLIANKNNYLYLIARDWEDLWLNDPMATYIPLPEDKLLVNMVAPKQFTFTAAQEDQTNVIKAAAMTEFTRTYNPPVREPTRRKSTGKEKDKKEKLSPKSKGTKKK